MAVVVVLALVLVKFRHVLLELAVWAGVVAVLAVAAAAVVLAVRLARRRLSGSAFGTAPRGRNRKPLSKGARVAASCAPGRVGALPAGVT